MVARDQLAEEPEREELEKLRVLETEIGREYMHGATLISESYFVKYAAQYADDIGAIDRNASWPLTHIDWEAAAEELKSDFTTVEIDGDTYYFNG